jgi:inorganic pyrophosphatase
MIGAMRSDFHHLSAGDDASKVVHVVVEIPKGCCNKYEYDASLGAFVLDRPLYAPLHYPGDYGFVPGTLSQDGDALDALILLETPTFPGCVVRMRVVGLLELIDGGQRDGKLIGVSINEPRTAQIHDIKDIGPHRLREIEYFFDTYKELEGKRTSSKRWLGAAKARRLVVDARAAYEHRQGTAVKAKGASRRAKRSSRSA